MKRSKKDIMATISKKVMVRTECPTAGSGRTVPSVVGMVHDDGSVTYSSVCQEDVRSVAGLVGWFGLDPIKQIVTTW